MRSGVLQQVGTPRELYVNPRNLFVAGFIGSPAMNFFPAHAEGGVVKLPFAEVPAPEGLADAGEVIAGVRPEEFEDAGLAPEGRAGGVTFDASVELIESMGSEIYAYFSYEGEGVSSDELAELARDSGAADTPGDGDGKSRAVARLNPESEVRAGETAKLWLDGARIHIFDRHDGANLALRGRGDEPQGREDDDPAPSSSEHDGEAEPGERERAGP